MKTFKYLLLILYFIFSTTNVYGAFPPKLNFTDLVSGPSSGLGDSIGSGVIVTIWGQNLGSSQSDSNIYFENSSGAVTEIDVVYYWKNADGEKPGSAVDLYSSHRMQELAVSIPNLSNDSGHLYVNVDGINSNKLPFTIRDGDIYHVSTSGSDTSNDGSFVNPWRTISHALEELSNNPGSTLYLHNDIETRNDNDRAVLWDEANASSEGDNQFSLVAYPGSFPLFRGRIGIDNFNVTGLVMSKLLVQASHPDCNELANGQPNCSPGLETYAIRGSKDGRAVGNSITEIPGYCPNGRQGAINVTHIGSTDQVSNFQVLGNEIYDYGCAGSSKFTHTTYFTVRNRDDAQVGPWRFAYNYLHDNEAKNGIHHYDQKIGDFCGSPTDIMKIHDNVVINQAGSGINVGGALACDWIADFEIYNNVLINTGLATTWDGVDVSTAEDVSTSAIQIQNSGISGDFRIFNNTIVDWNADGVTNGLQACIGFYGQVENNNQVLFSENICSTKLDKPFIASSKNLEENLALLEGSINNIWHYDSSDTDPEFAIHPNVDEFLILHTSSTPDTGVLADPEISLTRHIISIGDTSAALNNASFPFMDVSHDIYGVPRASSFSEIGAVELIIQPNPPYNLRVTQ